MLDLDKELPQAPNPYQTKEFRNTHYVYDGEILAIDKSRFQMTRHPDSTEQWELIKIDAKKAKDLGDTV